MPYYVYIIYSDKVHKKYIGHTENIEQRLKQHNEGSLGKYTKNKGPWKLVHMEEYSTRSEAMAKENFFKTGRGRDLLKQQFNI
ncbi:MAG: GIY-YIG nuclease family protein [Sphingobacteriaceae bacterium]|nr:GIY-YIG nuclease family protein [Sphingobacteriaceae bacterium]MBK7818129.1 GIY-YIG nuclease family protein [Sphingobacteriaceae bacterium]